MPPGSQTAPSQVKVLILQATSISTGSDDETTAIGIDDDDFGFIFHRFTLEAQQSEPVTIRYNDFT